MTTYHCRLNTCEFESDSPLGIVSHATKHKNQFEDIVGRQPDDYSEVLQLFNKKRGIDGHDPFCPRCGQQLYNQDTLVVPIQHYEHCDGGDEQ